MELFAVALTLGIVMAVLYSCYLKFLLSGVVYECSFSSEEVFEGEEIEFTETVTNSKFLPVPWMKSELTVPSALEFSELSSVVTGKTRWVTGFFALRSFSRIKRTWKVKCSARGIYQIDRIIVTATDPLGLKKEYFILKKNEINAGTITVLPVFSGYESAESEVGASSGEIFTNARLLSDPFFINGIREYRITDSMKSINWFATAKSGELMVNINDYTTDKEITVVLNIQSMESDRNEVARTDYVEKCIRVCASVIHDNCVNGRKIRLMSNDITGGEMLCCESTDEFTLLRVLAGIEIIPGEHIESYLENTAAVSGDGELIVVSSFRADSFDELKLEYPNLTFIYPETGGEAV